MIIERTENPQWLSNAYLVADQPAGAGVLIDGNDELTGNQVANVLTGRGGNDVLNGKAGNDLIDGGAGNDTAKYSGAKTDYQITHLTNGDFQVTDLRSGSPEGTDTLHSVDLDAYVAEHAGEWRRLEVLSRSRTSDVRSPLKSFCGV